MLRKLSLKLYSVSSLLLCLLAMTVMVIYAQFIMGGQAAQYNYLLSGDIKVPDLMFGYSSEELLSFMLLLGPAKLKLYLNVVLIWDSIFPVVYTIMNVLLISYIYRDTASSRYYWINLLPLISIPLDLFENTFEILMVKDYLNHFTVSEWMIASGSCAGVVKWCFTYFLYTLLAYGIVRTVYKKLRNRREEQS